MASVIDIRRPDAVIETFPVLDGTRYRLLVQWNARERLWTAGLKTFDNRDIMRGRALRVNENLFGQLVDARLPGGALMVLDTSGRGVDPARDDLRTGRVKLVYLTAAEVAGAP